MRMTTGLLILTLTGSLVGAESKEVHRTLPLDAAGRLVIDTYKGSVRVSTWDRNEVDVALRIEEDWGWFAESIRHADLEVDARRSEVRLKSSYAGSPFSFSGSQPLFHYTIRMPRSAELRIKDHKSDTEIEGLTGDLEINTYKGSLRARELAGGLRVYTYKGEVRAEFAAFHERSRVETYKGTIELGLPRASKFNLQADLGDKARLDSDFVQAESQPERSGMARGGMYRTRMSHARYRRNRSVNDSVNGGGPELRLQSYKGRFRVWER